LSSSTPFIDLIGSKILQVISAKLTAHGLLLKTDTVVDAKLIAAPNSSKNKVGDRDPEMHQFKKGNQWRFGMKANNGADAESGYQSASKRPDATDVDGRAYVLRPLGTANDHRFARVTGVRGQL